MTVTKIERQSRNKNRYSVFLDGEFAFGIGSGELLEFKLAEGAVLSAQKLAEIKNECEYAYARDKAVRLLSVRQRSERELRERLSGEFGADTVERVTALMKSYTYLDDRAFAEAYYKELTAKNKSAREIKYKLEQKGISRELISEICVEENGQEACVALLEKKYRKSGVDEADRRKALSYLAGKGFGYDSAKRAVNAFFASRDENILIEEADDDYEA